MRRVVREDRRLNDELAEQNRRAYHDITSSYPLYFFDHFFTFFWPLFLACLFYEDVQTAVRSREEQEMEGSGGIIDSEPEEWGRGKKTPTSPSW